MNGKSDKLDQIMHLRMMGLPITKDHEDWLIEQVQQGEKALKRIKMAVDFYTSEDDNK